MQIFIRESEKSSIQTIYRYQPFIKKEEQKFDIYEYINGYKMSAEVAPRLTFNRKRQCRSSPLYMFRALYSLGPDVGCYAPPMLYEKEHNESLQVVF